MMEQWQQMTSQQKAVAIGLVAIIVVALAFIIWWLVSSNRPPTPAPISQPSPAGAPTAGAPGAPSPAGTPTTPTTPGTPPELAGMPPEMMGAPGVTPTQPTQPPTAAPTGPQPGKLTRPPEPGREDPFGALPAPEPQRVTVSATTPPVPPVTVPRRIAEPLIAREQPQNRLPMLSLQGVPEVNFGAYLTPTATPRHPTDASGWRMVGFLMSEQRVSAVVQLPTGRTRVVQPGSTLEVEGTTYTVTKVEPDRVTLRSSTGEEMTVPRRPVQPVAPPFGPYGPGVPYGGGGAGVGE